MKIIFSVLLFGLLFVNASAKTLVEQAYEAGALDLGTALIYQAQSARDAGSIPSEYQQKPSRAFCGTPHVVEAVSAIAHLGEAYGQRLGKLVQRRPNKALDAVSPSGRFRIHYDIEGSDAVDPTDTDNNGIPDYIDLTATVLDSMWVLEVDQLGYNAPPDDGGVAGDEYDVYVADLGRGGAYGFTYPERAGKTSSSYLEIDNDYTNAIYQQTKGHDALRVTIAHEFHHAIQFGYYQGSDSIWWQESTSTWMEEVAYPEVDDYLQYLPSFLGSPHRALNSGSRVGADFHIYGTSIFSHFLDQRYSREVNRLVWEEMGRRGNAQLEHFNRVLLGIQPGGLSIAVSQFAVWNYFTGSRFREGYYEEGFKYPQVPTRDLEVDENASALDENSLDATSSAYVRLSPRLRGGGATFTFRPGRGLWRRHLVLVSSDSVIVQAISDEQTRVAGWDQYQEVIMVVTSGEESGFAYSYTLEAAYDPALTDAPAAMASGLRPSMPNPFHPAQGTPVRFVFDLAESSETTQLSVYTANGDLVWQRDLGPRAARQGHDTTWDGRNTAGTMVSSGVYHLLLETEGRVAKRSMAVVRD
ncbi:MAG: hypothetical protein ACI906_001530 [Candidatus Latescibacterota bacterium]|jgi:hypothetical protein